MYVNMMLSNKSTSCLMVPDPHKSGSWGLLSLSAPQRVVRRIKQELGYWALANTSRDFMNMRWMFLDEQARFSQKEATLQVLRRDGAFVRQGCKGSREQQKVRTATLARRNAEGDILSEQLNDSGLDSQGTENEQHDAENEQ